MEASLLASRLDPAEAAGKPGGDLADARALSVQTTKGAEMRRVWLMLLVGGVSGCSGAAPGGPAPVAIETNPAGATCTVQRGGTVLGVVATPGSLAVGPSEKDLTVTCTKPGFQTATGTVKAIYKGVGLGQLLTGGAAAVVEDAAKGTDFHYDPAGANLTLAPG